MNILEYVQRLWGARGDAIGWGTALQAVSKIAGLIHLREMRKQIVCIVEEFGMFISLVEVGYFVKTWLMNT